MIERDWKRNLILDGVVTLQSATINTNWIEIETSSWLKLTDSEKQQLNIQQSMKTEQKLIETDFECKASLETKKLNVNRTLIENNCIPKHSWINNRKHNWQRKPLKVDKTELEEYLCDI